MREVEAREAHAAAIVWNTWADYWSTRVEKVPPLQFLRVGGGEDYIFVSAVSEADLDGFISTVKATPDLKFKRQGSFWLQPTIWFGTWVVFSAVVRQAFVGIERRLFSDDTVYDFDRLGDPRTTPLRSDVGIEKA